VLWIITYLYRVMFVCIFNAWGESCGILDLCVISWAKLAVCCILLSQSINSHCVTSSVLFNNVKFFVALRSWQSCGLAWIRRSLHPRTSFSTCSCLTEMSRSVCCCFYICLSSIHPCVDYVLAHCTGWRVNKWNIRATYRSTNQTALVIITSHYCCSEGWLNWT